MVLYLLLLLNYGLVTVPKSYEEVYYVIRFFSLRGPKCHPSTYDVNSLKSRVHGHVESIDSVMIFPVHFPPSLFSL